MYEKMYKFYRLGKLDEMKTCIKTIVLYLGNIVKNPQDKKYWQINKENVNY